MPPGVLAQEYVTLGTTLGDLTFRTLSYRSSDRNFTVAYLPSLTEEQREDPEVLLKAIQEKVAPEDEFELTNTRSIKIDDFPGIELTFTGERDMIQLRTYLVAQKVYVIGVRYPKDKPEERQNRAFLNALQLLPPS
jgi:hypothetical protein